MKSLKILQLHFLIFSLLSNYIYGQLTTKNFSFNISSGFFQPTKTKSLSFSYNNKNTSFSFDYNYYSTLEKHIEYIPSRVINRNETEAIKLVERRKTNNVGFSISKKLILSKFKQWENKIGIGKSTYDEFLNYNVIYPRSGGWFCLVCAFPPYLVHDTKKVKTEYIKFESNLIFLGESSKWFKPKIGIEAMYNYNDFFFLLKIGVNLDFLKIK